MAEPGCWRCADCRYRPLGRGRPAVQTCPRCRGDFRWERECNDGYVERPATPEEVDAGCELGIAFDPCPRCNQKEPDDLRC